MAALAVNTANVRTSSQAQTQLVGPAGVDVTQGQPVYLDGITATYLLANALISNAPSGVAVTNARNGQNFIMCTRDPNFRPGCTIAAGNSIIVGNVAGQLNDIADRATGWYVNSLGVGIGNSNTNFTMTGSNVAM